GATGARAPGAGAAAPGPSPRGPGPGGPATAGGWPRPARGGGAARGGGGGGCDLLPHVGQRGERDRGGTQGAADPRPGGSNALPQRLLLRKAEEGKPAHLAKIVGDQVLALRICCGEGGCRRRVALQGRLCLVGLFPHVVLNEVPREQCVRWQFLCQR